MEVTTVLLYILIVVVWVSLYFIKRNLNYWKDQGIPHEEPHIIMGNCKGLRTKYNIIEIAADYYRKFKGTGPFAGIHLVQRPAVVLLDKVLIKNILIKDFNNFTDRGLYYNEKSDPLTGHIVFLEGKKWRNLRTKLSPTFTSRKMKYMYPILQKVTEQLQQVLSQEVNENPVVNIYDILSRYTTDIISSCAFGMEWNSLNNPNSEFPILGKKSLTIQRHNAFVMAIIDSFPKLARKLGMRVLTEDVHQFFMKTATEIITYREAHKIQRNDFLNILLKIKNNENDKSGLGGLNIEEACAQVFVLFIAGFETSASTMTYALYELAQHQEIQERLRQEVNEAIENSNDGKISYGVLKNMTYLNQVLSETLRKYPVVALLNRQAVDDYRVPGHPKYMIRKGMAVFIPVLGLHYDPEFYPNPQKFDPERFVPEMVKLRDPMEYLPFGSGPRNCMGSRFAEMQSRLGLATLLRNFRFSTCPKTEPLSYNPKALLYLPKNIIWLQLEKINLKTDY